MKMDEQILTGAISYGNFYQRERNRKGPEEVTCESVTGDFATR